ncbi:hypothetical protein [Vibrio mangrovi]|uniref:Uncharacterized protein n=1 Tax=Vibrio mangrovi TaxID=474394 RepID=A0A1Y6IU30_9VIBR|nr:hypothetical protein [Vibrio mangrovi]SMS01187.1 hypothetical protein VIM7927_02469 [Vibrio mangrovi]
MNQEDRKNEWIPDFACFSLSLHAMLYKYGCHRRNFTSFGGSDEAQICGEEYSPLE